MREALLREDTHFMEVAQLVACSSVSQWHSMVPMSSVFKRMGDIEFGSCCTQPRSTKTASGAVLQTSPLEGLPKVTMPAAH